MQSSRLSAHISWHLQKNRHKNKRSQLTAVYLLLKILYVCLFWLRLWADCWIIPFTPRFFSHVFHLHCIWDWNWKKSQWVIRCRRHRFGILPFNEYKSLGMFHFNVRYKNILLFRVCCLALHCIVLNAPWQGNAITMHSWYLIPVLHTISFFCISNMHCL